MKSILALAAMAALWSGVGLGAAQSAPAGPQSMAAGAQSGSLVQPVYYYRDGAHFSWYRGPHFGYYHGPNVTVAYWHRRPYYRPYGYGFYGAAFYAPYGYYGSYYNPVGYYGYGCRAWARECAIRWGWRTWRWGRCMRIHAC